MGECKNMSGPYLRTEEGDEGAVLCNHEDMEMDMELEIEPESDENKEFEMLNSDRNGAQYVLSLIITFKTVLLIVFLITSMAHTK